MSQETLKCKRCKADEIKKAGLCPTCYEEVRLSSRAVANEKYNEHHQIKVEENRNRNILYSPKIMALIGSCVFIGIFLGVILVDPQHRPTNTALISGSIVSAMAAILYFVFTIIEYHLLASNSEYVSIRHALLAPKERVIQPFVTMLLNIATFVILNVAFQKIDWSIILN